MLLSHAAPGLLWLWFAPLVAGGLWFWRRRGLLVPLGLVTFSLFWGFFGAARPAAPRELTLVASAEALSQLAEVTALRIVSDAGRVVVRPGDWDIQVSYRGVRRPPQRFYAELAGSTLTLAATPERDELVATIAVTLPRGIDLSIDNARADLEVSGIGGALAIESESGKIDVVFDQAPQADIRIAAQRSDIRLVLPKASDVTITAISGARKVSGELVRITPEQYRLNLGSEQHAITLESARGAINVQLR